MTRPLIVITNDDGIRSPGLAASIIALDPLGDLVIVAPKEQQSGMGRSMPLHHNGRLTETTITIKDKSWTAYSAEASPAQAVNHAILEVAKRKPDLVVSGINFGENVGMGVTVSGTVGAALEGAAHDVPSLAISLQVDASLHIHYDDSVDFSTAIYFTRHFAQKLLNAESIQDVDALKIDIPAQATPDTPCMITRLERKRYYVPVPVIEKNIGDKGRIGYRVAPKVEVSGPDTDISALLAGYVSITPLSLDLTSRVDLSELQSYCLND